MKVEACRVRNEFIDTSSGRLSKIWLKKFKSLVNLRYCELTAAEDSDGYGTATHNDYCWSHRIKSPIH